MKRRDVVKDHDHGPFTTVNSALGLEINKNQFFIYLSLPFADVCKRKGKKTENILGLFSKPQKHTNFMKSN